MMKIRANTFRAAQWGKLLILAVLAMSLPGHGEATSGSFSAPITILRNLGALHLSNLRFGQLQRDDDVQPGTVTISTISGCTSSNGTTATCNINVVGASQFLITGAPNRFYNISVPTSLPLTDNLGTYPNAITPIFGTNVTVRSKNIGSSTVGRLNGSGSDEVFVGARVVYTRSSVGNVTSNFAISVSY